VPVKRPLLAALAAALVLGAAFFPLRVLEVAREGGRPRLHGPPWEGDSFSLCFLHSVEGTPVCDHFLVDEKGGLVLYETTFSSLNTGMPTGVREGERVSLEGGVVRLTGRRIPVGEVVLAVTPSAANSLAVGGRTVDLPGLAGEGRLRLRIARRGAAIYILHVAGRVLRGF